MNGKSASRPAGRGTSAPPVSDCPDDISKLFPLSSCRSQLIPPAPNRRRSAIDFLYDFCGSSWIAYGASSLLVISHFPSPLPAHESLVGPFFRQVIEPSTCGADDGTDAVNAVSWCPARPSEGEVAAAQGNSIRLYVPRVDNDTGSFCWGQTTGILQSSMVEAIEWTGSGDGIIAAGVEVVFWQRKGRSWVMAWKSLADVPQVMVSATWSSEGLVATSAGCLLTSKVENSPNLANGGCKHVSVYQNYGKSEVLKIQLYHPQPISLIRWRPSTSISLTKRNLLAWRDVLLTCCLDGTVRLWSEIDNGRSKKLIKGIDHKMSKSFQVVAIIEIEQCLNGTLGTDVFIDWAGDMGSVILTSEEDDYSLSSVSSRLDNIASCEWLISVGPVNSVTFWAIHCLDDVVTFRSPRVTLWTKRNPADFQVGNFSFYQPLHPEEKPILVKVVVSRSQLFGPPLACSLLQLLPGNSMNWWHFYSPSIDDAEQKSLTLVSKKRCLSHFASGVLNLDGHTASILKLVLHPYSFELEIAVSLDSNGFLLFWSLPKNFNCTLGIQRYIHPTWKLLGKIRSQDLSVDLKYLTMTWLPLVLDDKPLLLLGYADGIDCFLINALGEGVAILCCKIFSLSFAGHNHSEGSPDHIFATPFPSFSTSFLVCAVWMKEFKALSWKVVLQSEDLTGSSCAFSSDSESVSRPEDISGRISCSGTYSAAISPASWNFLDSHTSKIILCVSVVTLDHSILSNGKHVVSDNDSCGNSCSLMATGCSDGILQLWKLHSAKSSESECIPWFYVGEFAAHDGPVNAVSLSNCGSKVATVSIGAKNSNFTLHIWTPICFTGGGSFILEDVLLLSGPVVALKWLTIGNGKLLLGVCMPNEFHIYCQRRAHNEFLESDELEEKHAWCCISKSHSHHPCHEFLWGPMLTPVLLHENIISIFSEWLCETEYKHIGDISSIVTDEYLCCDISLENNGHGAKELKKCGEKETGIFLDVLSSGRFMKNNLDTRKRLHNLMDFVERLCGPLESYHPWALLQYLYRGNWKRAYIVLKHLVDSLKSSGASTIILESCNLGKSSHIPQIPLPKYLEGMTPGESESSTSQWSQGNSFDSETSEKNAFLFGEETLKPLSLTAYPKSEIVGFIETLETDHNLSALTGMERIQILAVLEVLLELCQTTLFESLDEPARRFWVAVRFQHFHFIRKAGKVADAEEHAIESWLVAWAFQSDSQGSLLNSVLSAEPSWLEMRNLGLGFWLTNVSELRARMEKLARLQYLKCKNPKDCALLYLALNRLQVLAGLFKISKDEKDKVLFKFLSRNFQEEKNKAAALKNAYVLMGTHQLELAVAFFLLGGEPFSAVTVCAKNLGDEQLALVICRLLEGFGGPLEHQLITNMLLPHAIENKDYWLSSLLEWSLGNYSESVKRLFEPSGNPTNHTSARKCPHVSLADPNIGRYCVILASKHCLRNSIGDYQATVLSKLATMMDSYSLDRFGLPLEALECFASYTMKGNADGSSEDIEAHDIFQVLLNPFSTSASTRTWLQEGFAYHLESNIRFSLAMQYISRLLREFSCWTYKNSAVFPELVKHDDSESDGDEYQIEEFRHKLNLVILVFERRFSLKLTDLANMVLLFARNNGLLFLGYQLMLGIVFWEHEVDNHHKTRHSTVHSAVLRLLVQASKQLFCVFSRYIVSCHLSDSTLKLLSGSLSTEENYNDDHFQRIFCLRSLICSLRIIKPLLKYYDHLLVTEGLTLSTYSLFELVEYMMHFSYNWFSRNFRGLIRMVYQTRKASLSNHDSIEVLAGDLMKILYRNTCEALNDDAEVLRGFISDKNQVEQNESLALSIPEDERRLLIEVSLWIHNNSFTNQHLSKFLGTEKFATGRTKMDHNQFPVLLTKVTMASISYISSSLTRQLASFLRKKASQDLPVATFAWLELTNHCEFSSLPPDVDQGAYIRQLSSIEDREALFERLWVMSVNAKEIFQNLNERVYGFTYKSKKLPSSWKDFLKVNLSVDESRASHHRSEGNLISTSSVTGALLAKESSDADNSPETRRDSNPKLENVNFFKPSEIVNRSGELLEAICCNSIDEQQLAVASNRKGLLFLNWKMESSHKEKPLLIWPEADWPLNGCTSFENTPVSTYVSQDVGLRSKTGSHIHGTAEKVSSRSLRSHPSRPFLLVGSINTHIYLWEFGREKSTVSFGVLPAANVHPPHALASISSLEFNHCGHRFASTALDGTVCTWQLGIEGRNNVPPTESTICFSSHASDVAYVAASGSILAAAGCSANGQNVVLWDTLAPPATSQASLFCHEGGASSLAVFDSDVGTGSVSPIIVTGGKTGDVGLHDFRYIATGRSKRYQQPRDRDFRSSKNVDSSQHVDSENGMIWYIPKAHLGSVTRITTIPNTDMFLTGSKDGDVKLWDAKREQLVFHWRRIHDRHTFIQPTSRSIGGVVRAAVTDIEVFSHGFLTCGGDGSVKLVQLK